MRIDRNVSISDVSQIHIAEAYVNATYDSCKYIVNPTSGNLAMDIGCGDKGASRCNPKM